MVNARKRRIGWLGMALVVGSIGCSGHDAERLARIGRKAASQARLLTGMHPDEGAPGWHSVWNSWDEVTVEARVAARLRWDKALANAAIQVRFVAGVVELRGCVHDLAQRRRAVELAESTTGVEKVADALEAPPRSP